MRISEYINYARPAAGTLAMVVLPLSGCGGKVIIDAIDGTTSSSSTSSTTTSSSGNGGGTSGMTVTLVGEPAVGMNCMPDVPFDPVGVGFELSYDNSAASTAGQATIVNARVLFGGPPKTLTWSFDVVPTDSGAVAAGNTKNVKHAKVDNSGSGDQSNAPCSFCDSAALLELDLVVNGIPKAVTGGTHATCVY